MKLWAFFFGPPAEAPISGTVAQTMPAFGQAGAGTVGVTGTAAQTMAGLEQAAAGTVGVTGAGAQTMPAFGQAGAGTVGVTGAAAQTMPAFEQAAAGTVGEADGIEGTAAQTMAGFEQAAAGTVEIEGDAAQTMPAFGQAAAGTVGVTGAVAQTMAAFEQAAAGEGVSSTGTVAQTMAGFTQEALGELPAGPSFEENMRDWLISFGLCPGPGARVHYNVAPEHYAGAYVWFARRDQAFENTLDSQPGEEPFEVVLDVEAVALDEQAIDIGNLLEDSCHGHVGAFGAGRVQAVFVDDQADDYTPRGLVSDESVEWCALRLRVLGYEGAAP